MISFTGQQSRNFTLIKDESDWNQFTGGYWNKISETPQEYPCWALEDVTNTYCREYYNYSLLYMSDLIEMLYMAKNE
jgi:hypothetical protein